MTANAFGIARCTVGQIIQEICIILTKNIGSEFIKFPETKEGVSTEISAFLQPFEFPQVIGCIDGTHIPIKNLMKMPMITFLTNKLIRSTVKLSVMHLVNLPTWK